MRRTATAVAVAAITALGLAVPAVTSPALVGTPSCGATPSPTPTPSPSATPSGSPTASPSPSPSPKPSPSPSPAFTYSPNPTVPGPTPVPPCGSPSAFPTTLHTPAPSSSPPPIEAAAAILEDLDTGQVLFARHPDRRRPIASITKVMTAVLALRQLSLAKLVTVGPDAAEQGATRFGLSELGLKLGERISAANLLYALILQSSNDAAIALADAVSGSVDAFVSAMNGRARSLGLVNTRFFSPNGLDDRGYSTAGDLARIARAAYRSPAFHRIASAKFREIPSPSRRPRIVQNRNVLLWLYRGAIGTKTGWTTAAGFCLIGAAERDGRRLISVVLGDRSEQASFDDSAALLDYGFHAFRERLLVHPGEAFPAVPAGSRRYSVSATGVLRRLVPIGRARVVRQEVFDPAIALPLAKGQAVGWVVVVVDGKRAGRVTLVVSGPPSGPPGRSGDPWWSATIGGAGRSLWRAFVGFFG